MQEQRHVRQGDVLVVGARFVLGLLSGSPAHAATVSIVNKTTTGPAGDQRLRSAVTYKAGAGERNDLALTVVAQGEFGPLR